jgi:hypothetical protein
MIPAEEILKISRNNTLDRWAAGDGSAAGRIAENLVVPASRQTFSARPQDKFFAIGSCFARNVEERLELAGATVTSRLINVRDLGNKSAREGGMFNKYTPASILQELRWAAGRADYPEAALLPVGDGTYYDPYLSGKAGAGSVDDLMARRAEVKAYFTQAFDADVVILTLGLIEAWVDLETGLILNEAPAPKVLARNKERFGFERLTLEQCEEALAEIHDILKSHGKPGQKIILTVSPVPLGRTFTADDIIVANTTSKSTLRVAAMRMAERTDGLDYFPSYEAVLHSHPALSWQSDRLHVSDVVVGRIIQTFMSRYGVTKSAAQPDGPAEVAEDSTDTFLAQLNEDVNKYKNMVIQMQKRLRNVDQDDEGAPAVTNSVMRKDPAFAKWANEALDADALLSRVYREMRKYKNMVIKMQDEQRAALSDD